MTPLQPIEQITADAKRYDAVPGLHLPPHIHYLSIDYTALSLAVPEKVRFHYRLEGADSDWHEVVNIRQVEYSNLDPGSYHFQVIACNNSGVWNEQGAFLDFTVLSAYYQTKWFRAVCVLTFLAMLWTIYHLRVRGLHRRQAVLIQHHESLERLETEIHALNDQMVKTQ